MLIKKKIREAFNKDKNLAYFKAGKLVANVHTCNVENASTGSDFLAYVEYKNWLTSDAVQLKNKKTYNNDWTVYIEFIVDEIILDADPVKNSVTI